MEPKYQGLGDWLEQLLYRGPQLDQYQGPKPELSIESMGQGAPRYGGGLTMPLGAGSVGVRGHYVPPMPQQPMPPDWGLMFQYRRPF